MGRMLVIARHTFWEAVAQAIFSMLLVVCATIVIIFAVLPFFTLGEDARMYKAVCLDLVLVITLIGTLFAASRTINDEIEDRTMLTLMSKPVSRLEVLVGKYLGLIASAAVAVAILSVILSICIYFRIPGDFSINAQSVDEYELNRLRDYRIMHTVGLLTSMLMVWLQVAVLAAISVAISTRVSLVVNLPVVILFYVAGNLTRFLDSAAYGAGWVTKIGAQVINTIMPFLSMFDLRDKTVYANIAITPTFRGEVQAVSAEALAMEVGVAFLYGALYITAVLAAGLLLLRSRELSGAAE